MLKNLALHAAMLEVYFMWTKTRVEMRKSEIS